MKPWKILRTVFVWITVCALLWGTVSLAAEEEKSSGGSFFSANDQQEISQYTDEYVAGAENEHFVLHVNKKQAVIRLTDKASGTIYTSSPDGYENDPLAKGTAMTDMGSIIIIKYAHRDSNTIVKNSKVSSSNKNNVKITVTEKGLRMDFYFPLERFYIPVEITLEENVFKASILCGEISEKGSQYLLTAVELLPYFGAAFTEDTGYMLVPDGSGALIEHNSASKNYTPYSETVYGEDTSIMKETKVAKAAKIHLPVFGMKKNDSGFLAIVEQGDERARINAGTSGFKSSYNNINAEMICRQTETIPVQTHNWGWITLTKFEPSPSAAPFTVGYRFLSGESADYSGMAKAYQNYLVDTGVLAQRPHPQANPFYVSLIGGEEEADTFLGVPVQRVEPVVMYKDVAAMTKALKKLGIEDITYHYTQWEKGGNNRGLYPSFQIESRLGSRKSFETMLAKVKEDGARMVLSLTLTDFSKNVLGYGKKSAARSMERKPVMDYFYRINTNAIDSKAFSPYLLLPEKVPQLAEKQLASIEKYKPDGVSAGKIGQNLYSDFANQNATRTETKGYWQETAAKLSRSTALLVPKADAYVLSHVSEILEAPVTSQKHLLFTADVPFYQMVLHGYIPMSLPAVNSFSNSREILLQGAEGGLYLHFAFDYRRKGSDWSLWHKDASDYYKAFAAVAALGNVPIKRHDRLLPGVTKTTYENGKTVLVNRTQQTVEAEGVFVPPMDFIVK